MISDRLRDASAVLLALMPMLFLAGPAISDIASILIGLAWISHCVTRRDWAWLNASWVQLALLLYAYMLVSCLGSAHVMESLERAASWIRYPLFAMAVMYWLFASDQVRRFLPLSLLMTITFLVLDMAWQYYTGRDLFGRLPFASEEGMLRLTGPYSAPRVGITLVWLMFPAIAWLLGNAKIPLKKAAAFALWGSCVIMIFLSGERMATLLALFGSGLLMLLMPHARKIALALIPAAVLVIGAFSLVNPALINRQVSTTLQAAGQLETSPYGRLWINGLKMLEDHPWLGVGAKQFRHACLEERYGGTVQKLNCNLHPHHLYLEWAVEYGLIGLGLFLAMLTACAREVVNAWKLLPQDSVTYGLIIACIIKLFPFSTAVSFFVSWSALPFWLALGWLMAISRDLKRALC